jgi:hypothetical protein
MKPTRTIVLVTLLILISTGVVDARAIRWWSDRELLDKSELVVIATPTFTRDTKDHAGIPGFEDQPVIGVETKFAVITVLKGPPAMKTVLLYHYRADQMAVPNAPSFLTFEPKKRYRLYLLREANGRYAPVSGQIDPEISVRKEVSK